MTLFILYAHNTIATEALYMSHEMMFDSKEVFSILEARVEACENHYSITLL